MYKFQYYPATINGSTPLGYVTIDQFFKANSDPKPETVLIFDQIAECSKNGDLKTKAELKEKLFSFTPCINVSFKRRYADIISFTGLMVLDFDKIDNAPEFKEFLFNEYNFIYACWMSPSRKGVKALVQIPEITLTTWQESTDVFKSYYFGIAEEMEQYNGFDTTGQNCVLPLFQSLDKNILINPFPFKWVDKGFKRSNFITSTPTVIDHVSEGKESVIVKIINTSINKIIDNGHPQLRSACLAIGGYISSGYIDFQTALNQVFYCIETNSYLQKGIPGYKKTAKEFLNLGMSKPLYL
jgi:hypothetical protein